MTIPIIPEETAPTAVDASDRISATKLLKIWIALTFTALFVSVAQYAPLVLTLQMKLVELDPVGAATAVGVVVAVSMLAACIVGPLAGEFSDRTRSRRGMRRPWIIAGVAVGLAGTAIVAFASDTLVVGAGWTIANVGYSVANLIPMAMLTEQVPERHRGLVAFGLAGAGGIAAAIGAAIVPLFQGSLIWPILIPGIAAMVIVPLLLSFMPDRLLAGPVPRLTIRHLASAYWVNPKGRGGFISLLIAMFLVNFGFIVFSTYLYFILLVNNRVSETDAPYVIAAITAIGGVLSVVSGAVAAVISDRWGGRKYYLVGAALLLAAAMLGQAFVHGVTPVLLLTAVQYAASGVIFVFGLALLADVSRLETAGRDAGMYNTVITFAAVVGPFIAAMMISADPANLAPIFILVTSVTAVGAGFVAFSRHLK